VGGYYLGFKTPADQSTRAKQSQQLLMKNKKRVRLFWFLGDRHGHALGAGRHLDRIRWPTTALMKAKKLPAVTRTEGGRARGSGC
jgi:hypothetical protein